MPVPAVPWASPDGGVLGTPFIVMERLPGRVFLVWEPHGSFPRDPIQVRHVWLQAAQMLARLHKVDWRTSLSDWEKPRSLSEELDFWAPLLRGPDTNRCGTAQARLVLIWNDFIGDEAFDAIAQSGQLLWKFEVDHASLRADGWLAAQHANRRD